MCRLMAYMGHPALLADVVLWPDRSIIKQSYDARERIRDPTLPFHLGHGNLNGDGFGIGWFNSGEQRERDPTPCVFTSITPAWNNENLARLACKIISPVVFAHVRAAYPGMPVSEQNCHPFQWGRYLWMHNGVMGGFSQIRRALLAELSDTAYNTIQSFHSDSAVSFAIFLHHLPDLTAQHPPEVLLRAMHDTLATISRLQAAHNVTATSLLNFVVSDGTTLIATRYVYPETESPPSLYYAEGADFVRKAQEPADAEKAREAGCKLCSNASQLRGSSVLQESSYTLTFGERGASVALIASEPITGSSTDWVAVQRNTALVITREKSGYLNTMISPLAPTKELDHVVEVSRCLEAVSRGLDEQSRLWSPRAGGARHSRSDSRSDSDAQEPVVVTYEQHRLTGHKGAVLAMVLDPEAQRLYTASADTTVKVWDLEAGTCSHTLRGHRKPVVAMQVGEGRLYTIGGRIVRIWDTATFQCTFALNCSSESGYVRAFCVVPNSRVFVGSQDTTVRSLPLDPSTFDPAKFHTDSYPTHLPVVQPDCVTDPISSHVASVNALTLCGGYICSGGADSTVRVWRADDLSPVGVLRGHRGSVLCLLAVGNLLLSGARDNTIRVWDMESDMICRKTLSGHKDDVTSLSAVRLPAPPCLSRGFSSAHSLSSLPPDLQPPHPTAFHSSRPSTPPTFPPTCPPSDAHPSPFSNGVSHLNPHHAHQASFPQASACSDFSFHESSIPSSRANSADSGSPRAVPLPTEAPTSTLVASTSADGTLRIWTTGWVCIRIFSMASDLPALAQLSTSFSSLISPRQMSQPPPVSAALSVALNSRHIACGYADGCVRLWRSEELQYAANLACWDEEVAAPRCPPRAWEDDDSEAPAAATRNGRARDASGIATNSRRRATAEPDPDLTLLSCSAPTTSHRMPLHEVPIRMRTSKLAASPPWLLRMRSSNRLAASAKGQPRETIDQELERCLREFVRYKTVSADPKLREECFRGAKYLARLLESLGADIKMVRSSEERNPLVLGRIGDNPNRPTVTFYGHYDVQPAQEPDWQTDPFELSAVDGYLYGRGTSDNKGPVLAFVFAVKELLESYAAQPDAKSLPFNIAFLFEGEEEVGSVGFRDALLQNLRWFQGTKVVIMSNTLWVGEQRPCLTYGMRGMLAVSLEVTGPERELHSGNDGGVFNEPMLDLVKVAATLCDSKSHITIPGFYDHVQKGLLDLALPGLQNSHEFSAECYREVLGVPALTAPPNTQDLLHARWCRPSLSIVDMRPSYGSRGACKRGSCGHPHHEKNLNGTVAKAAAALGAAGGGGAAAVALAGGEGADALSKLLAPTGGWMACGMQRNEESWVWGVGTEHQTGAVASLFSFGPTRFSVIPKTAVAKISIRYVPQQNAVDLINSLKLHVHYEFTKLGSANTISVHVESAGDWWEADHDSQFFKMAEAAIRTEWGTDPLYVREGGTMPVASLIEKMLGAPALMIPMGQSSDNCHLANERIRRVNLLRGKNVIRHLLEELAVLSSEPEAGDRLSMDGLVVQ